MCAVMASTCSGRTAHIDPGAPAIAAAARALVAQAQAAGYFDAVGETAHAS